jgi:hypothetical protein
MEGRLPFFVYLPSFMTCIFSFKLSRAAPRPGGVEAEQQQEHIRETPLTGPGYL